MKSINLHGLQLDTVKMRMFREFLTFTLDKNRPLNYLEFNKNCGISRAQWEQFRALNVESNFNWSVE